MKNKGTILFLGWITLCWSVSAVGLLLQGHIIGAIVSTGVAALAAYCVLPVAKDEHESV